MLNLINSIVVSSFFNISVMQKYLEKPVLLGILVFYILVVNINPCYLIKKIKNKRLNICRQGYSLLIVFLLSMFLIIVQDIYYYANELMPQDVKVLIIHFISIFLIELILFWNGMVRIYISSIQLGIKWRVLGAIFGFVPIVNFIILLKIVNVARKEVKFEKTKILLNEERKDKQICKTKYPILLVHGVFFRDYKYYNYWGRIPQELKDNGATIFFGNHQSAASVKNSANELRQRIEEIIKENGCEKVNIIAHSKGGLDCKYLASLSNANDYIASVTTINTPHHGCEFADYILSKIPKGLLDNIANKYNNILKKVGDKNPDFIEAVKDLTANACEKLNDQCDIDSKIYCQSVGSKINKASKGKFPLNWTYKLVNLFDGANDGLVGEESFWWGEENTFIKCNNKNGISHADVIDLTRKNLDGFDVREFYVQLVYKLKQRGL